MTFLGKALERGSGVIALSVPWHAVLLMLVLFLSGCAQPPQLPASQLEFRTDWAGRMALQVDGESSRSFTAAFELHGNREHGQLKLLSPLGSTLAQINWMPGQAQIETSSEVQVSSSLDDLLQQATGAAIPVAALFDWLTGLHTVAAGWQVDLSSVEQGRIVALRQTPAPQATLRIMLER